jgi:hypothetical protein
MTHVMSRATFTPVADIMARSYKHRVVFIVPEFHVTNNLFVKLARRLMNPYLGYTPQLYTAEQLRDGSVEQMWDGLEELVLVVMDMGSKPIFRDLKKAQAAALMDAINRAKDVLWVTLGCYQTVDLAYEVNDVTIRGPVFENEVLDRFRHHGAPDTVSKLRFLIDLDLDEIDARKQGRVVRDTLLSMLALPRALGWREVISEDWGVLLVAGPETSA